MIPKKRLIFILPILVVAVFLVIQLVRRWSGDDRSVIKVSGNIELKDA
jgi:regulatory protein YycI of two-component signal transduction system YycFG